VHRVGDCAVLDPEACSAARVIASDAVDSLPHQLSHHQPAAHPPQQSREVFRTRADDEVVHAAGIARRLQPELAGRVRAQHIAGQHTLRDDLPIARHDAFAVERRAAERLAQVRTLGDLHPLREDLLARRIQQKRCATILTAAADCAEKTPEQATRQLGHEQYRCGHRRQLASVEASQGARGSLLADARAVFQVMPIANGAVPVVPLHLVTGFRNDDAAQAVNSRRGAAEEPERVTEHSHAAMSRKRRAFGITDARIGIERRRFAGERQIASRIRVDRPRVEQIEIGKVACERVRLR
jgi:hypothetical protein